MHDAVSWLAFIGLAATILSGCELVSDLSPVRFEDGELIVGDTFCAEYEAVPTAGQAATPEILEQIHVIMGERVDGFGVSGTVALGQSAHRASVELSGIANEGPDADALRRLIETTGMLKVVPVPSALVVEVIEGQPLPESLGAVDPLLTGSAIVAARPGQDPSGRLVVLLELTEVGVHLLDEYASDHLEERVAVVLDGIVLADPSAQGASAGGRLSVSGGFTAEEVDALITVLRSGPLPLPIREVTDGTFCP